VSSLSLEWIEVKAPLGKEGDWGFGIKDRKYKVPDIFGFHIIFY
jgi:hypothetical protein